MEPTNVNIDVQAITPAMVVRAYNGRAGKCCCGCSGNIFDANTDDATRTLRRIQSLPDVEAFMGLDGEVVVSATERGRDLIVYVKGVM
jgi:hypothetical protein